MYSEADIASAVEAGILTPEAAEALRLHVEARRPMPAADEEHFRLMGGFNDVFITLAIMLLMILPISAGGGILAAVAAWGLAEVVTRQRRLALPSVVLAFAFSIGLFFQLLAAIQPDGYDEARGWVGAAAAAAITFAATLAYWWRFRVPVVQAILAGVALAALFFTIRSAVPAAGDHVWLVLGIGGLAIFAYAMWWDLGDPERRTQRSDVAFWLHLLAAPLIAHPLFRAAGIFEGEGGMWPVTVLLIYAVFTIVALVVDRRAILVSGLGYALFAVAGLLGEIGDGFVPATVVLGAALLFLGLFWPAARAGLMRHAPEAWRRRLPPVQHPR